MSDDPEYLTAQQAADRCGVTRKSLLEMLARGYVPEPDLIFFNRPLWLPETIDGWRKRKGKRRPDRIPRSQRIKQPDASKRGAKLPKIAGGAARPSKGKRTLPPVSTVSDVIAKQIASALRQAGHHCTTEDVMLLASSTHEDERERDLLRQRIQAKLRGLKRRAL